LREVRFFEVDHADDGSAHYSTRYCDWWEPLNLGRAVHFELRNSRQSWEMQPVVTAPEIAGRIAARLDPAHPAYDERLAGYARSVEVHAPYSFTVHFNRVPVRIEPLLSIPILAHDPVIDPAPRVEATPLADEHSTQHDAQHVSFTGAPARGGGFPLAEVTSDRAVYRRALQEPDDVRQFHLAEIQEHRYADSDAALQGLLRGEVSMLARPPAWIVDLLLADEEMLKSFFVAKMAVPVTHVVQFHPHSQPLKNREYRRALAYGIDRQHILTETVLRGEGSRLGRVVNGPFPSRSDAVNALVETREYDPLAAVSLALAARKQFGGELRPLSMVVVDDPVVREAAERLIAAWSRIGIEVQLRDLPAGPLVGDEEAEPEWDLIYRTVQLTEPAVQLWPFLTLRPQARVSDLNPFSDWLRQEIISLDLVTDWRDAVQSVNRLHLRLWGEVLLLPLWEVDEYLIYRKNVRGVPVRPVHPYEDVDRWILEAWYPEPLR
jgi:ABC-type transport system substrate-binding protein